MIQKTSLLQKQIKQKTKQTNVEINAVMQVT